MKHANNKAIMAFEKTRNIASAVYLITDLMPDKDPLRTKLREVAIETVTIAVSGKGAVALDSRVVSRVLSPKLASMIYLMDVALASGLLSDRNHRLISVELSKLVEHVNLSHKVKSVSQVLEEGFSGFSRTKNPQSREFLRPLEGRESGGYPHKGHNGQSGTQDLSFTEQGSNPFNNGDERKKMILKTLEGGKIMSVRDLMSVIKNVSEKTIQRDLVSMVKDKTVKKTGEKRWSKYSLV